MPSSSWLCLCRYGSEQGQSKLREAITERLYAHVGRKPNEIFVSDGSKCDIGRLQLMFGADVSIATQVTGALRGCERNCSGTELGE